MARPPSDRALRHAATQLARLHPDDQNLILDALEPGEKAQIDALVSQLEGHLQVEAEPDPVWSYEGVSPWLRVRIDPNAKAGRANREFVLMTDAARASLVAAAEPFRAQRTPVGPGRSLMTHVWERLTGKTA